MTSGEEGVQKTSEASINPQVTVAIALQRQISSIISQPAVEQRFAHAINPRNTTDSLFKQVDSLRRSLVSEIPETLLEQLPIDPDIRDFIYHPITDRVLSELMKHKEQFQLVFETEKGSLYFVLPNGQTLRFKHKNIGTPEVFGGERVTSGINASELPPFYSLQEKADKCVFLSAEEAERIRNTDRYSRNHMSRFLQLINHIQTVPIAVGVTPFELTLFSEKYKSLIEPDTSGRIDTVLLAREYGLKADHRGHPVSRIIQNCSVESIPSEAK